MSDGNATPEISRNKGLDAVRGVAVALMILDHVLAAVEVNDLGGVAGQAVSLMRLTVTRPAMPIFMIVSGYTLTCYGVRGRRIIEAAAAAALVSVLWLTAPMGATPPDILALWVVAAVTFRWWSRTPIIVIVASFIQLTSWPVQWGGYQPGAILLFMAVGVLIHRNNITFPSFKEWDAPLGFLGRHPLSIYVGHIAAIWAAIIITGVLTN